MYMFFAIQYYYPNGGFSDLKFVFDNKEELKKKIDTELNAFSLYTDSDGEFCDCFDNCDQAEFVIWKLESLESLKDMTDFYRVELDEFLVYSKAPNETVWKGLNPESKEDIDKLNQMLYDDIVNNLGLE